jgi:hypothetical protein
LKINENEKERSIMEFKIEDVNINGIPLKKIFFSNIILETEAPDEYSRMFPNIIQVTDEDTETLAISFQKNRMEHRICIPQGGLTPFWDSSDSLLPEDLGWLPALFKKASENLEKVLDRIRQDTFRWAREPPEHFESNGFNIVFQNELDSIGNRRFKILTFWGIPTQSSWSEDAIGKHAVFTENNVIYIGSKRGSSYGIKELLDGKQKENIIRRIKSASEKFKS